VSHYDVLKYLQKYADYFQLIPLIQFNTAVVHVKPTGTNCRLNLVGDEQYPSSELPKQTFIFDQWNVTTKNLITKQTTVETYDAVVICNG